MSHFNYDKGYTKDRFSETVFPTATAATAHIALAGARCYGNASVRVANAYAEDVRLFGIEKYRGNIIKVGLAK